MKRALAILAVALLPLLPVLPQSAVAETLPPGTDLVGRWTLDPDRSDSIAPMMEVMGAPWFVRRMVDSLRSTMTVSLTQTGLHVLSQNRLRDSDREIVTDGAKREAKDQLDRTFTEWAEWQDDGSLKIWRLVPREDGTVIELEATWRRNGSVIELLSVVQAAGDAPVRTLRVFAPTEL